MSETTKYRSLSLCEGVLSLARQNLTRIKFFEDEGKCRRVELTVDNQEPEIFLIISGSGVKVLSCSWNKLTQLENLPKELKSLECNHNSLSKLENLPEGLLNLDCSDNSISRLDLPRNLKVLECEDNDLTMLYLPKSLTRLICSPGNFNLMFIEPLPQKPNYCSFPKKFEGLRNAQNYTKFYSRYQNHLQVLSYSLIYLALESGCSQFNILDTISNSIFNVWNASSVRELVQKVGERSDVDLVPMYEYDYPVLVEAAEVEDDEEE